MTLLNRLIVIAAVLSPAAIGLNALAQTPVTQKAICVHIGSSQREALDRVGHTLEEVPYSCRSEGGPFDDAVQTGTTTYEWDGLKGTVLAGNGIARKPGGTQVFQVTEGTITLLMTDGKVTGFTTAGKGVVKLATGNGAMQNGKTFTYTAHPVSAVAFVLETTYD